MRSRIRFVSARRLRNDQDWDVGASTCINQQPLVCWSVHAEGTYEKNDKNTFANYFEFKKDRQNNINASFSEENKGIKATFLYKRGEGGSAVSGLAKVHLDCKNLINII